MSGYKLTYFDIEGLAEPLRLIFVLARIPFEDHRIPYKPTEGPVVMPPEISQKLPYGQVPILEFEGKILSQSGAIGRFLAKRFDLYGTNQVQEAQIDEILEAFRDYGESFRTLRLARDDEGRAIALKNILQVSTPKYCTKFNAILQENGTGFFVGKGPTLADLIVSHFIQQFNYQVPGLTKDYPALEFLVKTVNLIPEIQEWNQNKLKK